MDSLYYKFTDEGVQQIVHYFKKIFLQQFIKSNLNKIPTDKIIASKSFKGYELNEEDKKKILPVLHSVSNYYRQFRNIDEFKELINQENDDIKRQIISIFNPMLVFAYYLTKLGKKVKINFSVDDKNDMILELEIENNMIFLELIHSISISPELDKVQLFRKVRFSERTYSKAVLDNVPTNYTDLKFKDNTLAKAIFDIAVKPDTGKDIDKAVSNYRGVIATSKFGI